MAVHTTNRWTPVEDEIALAALVAKQTYAQIGLLVGKPRNAVVGRIHRLRAARGEAAVPVKGRPKSANPRNRRNGRGGKDAATHLWLKKLKEAPPRLPHVPLATLTERFSEGYCGQQGRLWLVELTADVCRFPVDQPKGPVRYCGDTTRQGASYCPTHLERCCGRWT